MNKYYDDITGDYLYQRPDPFLIKQVFDKEYFDNLKSYILTKKEEREGFIYDAHFGRTTFHCSNAEDDSIFLDSAKKLVPLARKLFNSNTLDMSYCLFSHYKGNRANLYRHVDDNACTYTIDLCLYHVTPWSIFVEDKEFTPYPNEAVVYYGEDQYHWRGKFPDPKINQVGMIFYHFVDKDHWFFSGDDKSHSRIIERRAKHSSSKKEVETNNEL